MHPLTAESLAVSGFPGKKKRTKHRHIVSMFGPIMVRVTGVEPARLSAREPKSRMSANSIIPADIQLLSVRLNKIQHFRVKVKQKQREIVRISVKELADIVLIIAFATADKQQCETN